MLGTGDREGNRAATRGQHAAREPDRRPVIQYHYPAGAVQAHGARAQPKVDAFLGVEAIVLQRQLVSPNVPTKVVLRQWWPVVRRMSIDGNDADWPGATGLTEGARGLERGRSTADDDQTLALTAHAASCPHTADLMLRRE